MEILHSISRPFVLATALMISVLHAQDFSSTSTQLVVRIIAGSESDFMMVRHVILKGSNYEIGRQLSSFAKSSGISITPAHDSAVNKLKRDYLKQGYPAYYERMRGLAEGFGKNIEDNRWDFDVL